MSITSLQHPAPAPDPSRSTNASSASSNLPSDLSAGQTTSVQSSSADITLMGGAASLPGTLLPLKSAWNNKDGSRTQETQPGSPGDREDVAAMVAISRRTARSLWLILHAQKCKFGPGRCPLRGCSTSKRLLRHVSRCRCGGRSGSPYPANFSPCPENHNGCLQVRKLLAHYRRCGARQELAKAASLKAGTQHVPSTACLICEQLARFSPVVLEKTRPLTNADRTAVPVAAVFSPQQARDAAQDTDGKDDAVMDDVTAPNTDASTEASSISSNGSYHRSTSNETIAQPSRQSLISSPDVVNTSPKALVQGTADCKALSDAVLQRREKRDFGAPSGTLSAGTISASTKSASGFASLSPRVVSNKSIGSAYSFSAVPPPSGLNGAGLSCAVVSQGVCWIPCVCVSDAEVVTEKFVELKLSASPNVDICHEVASTEAGARQCTSSWPPANARTLRRPRSESFDERWAEASRSLVRSRPYAMPQSLTEKSHDRTIKDLTSGAGTRLSVGRRPRSYSCGSSPLSSIESFGGGRSGGSCDTIAEEEHEHDSAIA